MDDPDDIIFRIYPGFIPGINETEGYTIITKKENALHLAGYLGLLYVPEAHMSGNVCMAGSHEVRAEFRQTFNALHLRDYLYALAHTPGSTCCFRSHRSVRFSAIRLPEKAEDFWHVVQHGTRLISMHMHGPGCLPDSTAPFYSNGNQTVHLSGIHYDLNKGRIWLNGLHYFSGILPEIWEYRTGLIAPVQHWLRSRLQDTLEAADVTQFQKVVAVVDTTIKTGTYTGMLLK